MIESAESTVGNAGGSIFSQGGIVFCSISFTETQMHFSVHCIALVNQSSKGLALPC